MHIRGLIVLALALGLEFALTGGAAARHMHLQQLREQQQQAQARVAKGLAGVQLMSPWPVTAHDSGGVLLLSDSPEYVGEYGILYSDVIRGEARIFYYHVNVTDRPGKLAVVLENLGTRRTQVSVERSAMPEPGTNYFHVGKETQIGYMRIPQPVGKILLEAGSRNLLNPLMGVELLEPKELALGMYDISTTEPVRVTVVFCPAPGNPVDFVQRARVLPKDEVALRGTFKGMNRTLRARHSYDPERDGTVYIPIGDDYYDIYKQGIDATDGSRVINYGNYGVLYRLELPTIGSQPVKVMLTPLGGPYAGAVRVEAGRRESRVVHTPAGRLYFGTDTPGDLVPRTGKNAVLTKDFELALIGRFKPYRYFALEYSPPGASNLPVLLIMAPGDR